MHLAVGDAGQVEEVIDQPGLELDVAADHGNVGADFRRDVGIGFHRARRHQDRIQRRAQFVTEDGEEAVLRRVCALRVGQRVAQFVARLIERIRE